MDSDMCGWCGADLDDCLSDPCEERQEYWQAEYGT